MFTELIDVLRCPNAHADSWLVATSTRTQGRHIIDGALGCPVCRALLPIVRGVAQFGPAPSEVADVALDDDAAFRLAAQLHLVDAPQPVLLTGVMARASAPLRRLLPTVKVIVADAGPQDLSDEAVSAITLPAAGIPLAVGAVRALALDDQHAHGAWLDDASRVVRAAGRLVVPAHVALDPACWQVLASDAVVTVAERLAVASAPIPLRRAPSAPLFTP